RADREDAKINDGAAIRRANLRAIEHVLRRLQTRNEVDDLCLGFAEIFRHVGHSVVADLDDLKLHFTDRLSGTSYRRGDVAVLTTQARGGAFELENAGPLHQAFFQEEILVSELGGDDLDLLAHCQLLRLESGNLLIALMDTLVE